MRNRDVTYDTWYNMKQRCDDPNHMRYIDYGAKGITYCDRWKEYKNFKEDMGTRPAGLTLDRIKNDQPYSKENCRWATRVEQSFNQKVRKDNPNGIRGVSFHAQTGKWRAYGTKYGNTTQLYFGASYDEAVAARKTWETVNVPKQP